MVHLECIEVTPPREDRDFNPHFALIACEEENWEGGRVRIMPPFTASESFFATLLDDVGVELSPVLATKEATILDFCVDEDSPHCPSLSNYEKVRYTVEQLISELGAAASPVLFIKMYPNGEEQ